ncbi:hypothetical protein ER308_01260 [Egibacter rhizosphaerae]|uniref:Cell wall-active antibiotics response LiaF-like C-terminal domain-containing protein n=1 Tax=Egibacter rhizosphaerae TaxID=1670831 RepID=A0A411YAX6_9ACTN|nr:LiaF domain-containing protein [Egibacter rhizosphaerae]QBI18332.1 hypothetical protein ER308_01260 [Egibacter rhizosphaerae]
MNAPAAPSPPHEAPDPPAPRGSPAPEPGGRIEALVAGILLIGLGVGWLLDRLEVLTLPWPLAGALALVVVGFGIMATARRGGSGTLTAAGVVLSVVLLFGVAGEAPIPGALGEQTHRPTAVAELASPYELGIGSLTLDLRDLDLDGAEAHVEASVGVGELEILVPEDVEVEGSASVGIGEAALLGERGGGLGVNRDIVVSGVDGRLVLDVSVGVGRIDADR